MPDLAILGALHARLVLEARDCERLDYPENPHAERERANARELRAQAAALAELLAPHGVHVPDSRQLSLFSDGRS